MQTQAPISQYVSLCAQVGDLTHQRAVAYTRVQEIDTKLQALVFEMTQAKEKDAAVSAALAKREQDANEAGA